MTLCRIQKVRLHGLVKGFQPFEDVFFILFDTLVNLTHLRAPSVAFADTGATVAVGLIFNFSAIHVCELRHF